MSDSFQGLDINLNESVEHLPLGFDHANEVGRLMLTLQAKFNVTNEALNFLVHELSTLEEEASKKRQYLSSGTLMLFSAQNKRTRYFKEHFGLITPEEKVIGDKE